MSSVGQEPKVNQFLSNLAAKRPVHDIYAAWTEGGASREEVFPQLLANLDTLAELRKLSPGSRTLAFGRPVTFSHFDPGNEAIRAIRAFFTEHKEEPVYNIQDVDSNWYVKPGETGRVLTFLEESPDPRVSIIKSAAGKPYLLIGDPEIKRLIEAGVQKPEACLGFATVELFPIELEDPTDSQIVLESHFFRNSTMFLPYEIRRGMGNQDVFSSPGEGEYWKLYYPDWPNAPTLKFALPPEELKEADPADYWWQVAKCFATAAAYPEMDTRQYQEVWKQLQKEYERMKNGGHQERNRATKIKKNVDLRNFLVERLKK